MAKRQNRERPAADKSPDIFHVPAVVCAAVIAVAIGLLLHESLIGGKGLVPSDAVSQYLPWSKADAPKPANYLLFDQYLQFVPNRQFFHDELHKGRFPLWNPNVSSGVPNLASMQAAALYPINLLLSPLSPFAASGLAALAKLLIAGVFTLLYLRRLGVTNTGALVGGLTFTLSGFLVVWLGHPHTNSAVLLPALFYFVEGIVTGRRAIRQWSGLAATFGVVMLGGHLPTVVHMLMAIAAYAVFRMFTAHMAQRLKFGLLLAAAVTAGVLIAAPQLFPFAEYYQLSSSRQSSEALNRSATHLRPATLVHFVLPYFSGSPAVGFEELAKTLKLTSSDNFNERTGYVGLLAMFLAMVAVFRRRCAFTFFFAGMAFVAFTIIYAVPPWPAILRHVPVLQNINHARLILLVDWGAAVLAGLGADTLIRSQPHLRPRLLAIAFVAGLGVALAALWNVVGGASRFDEASRWFLASQAWILIGGLAAIVAVTLRRLGPRWVPAICVGWTAIDLLWFASGYNPAIAAEAYKPTTGAIRFLQEDQSQFRVFGLGTMLSPNLSGMYGIADVRGQDFMSVARYEEFITGSVGNFFFYMSADQLPPELAMRSAKYLLASERMPGEVPDMELVYDAEIAIYRNRRYLERALAVFDHRVERNPSVVLDAVRAPGFDPERAVWLEEEPADVAVESAQPGAASAADVRITRYEPDDVTIEARMPRAGFVLLLDTYFPGWQATVDDQATPIYRANYVYRAVRVPSGTHTITFAYRPSSFRWGLGASLMTLGLLAALWWRGRSGADI